MRKPVGHLVALADTTIGRQLDSAGMTDLLFVGRGQDRLQQSGTECTTPVLGYANPVEVRGARKLQSITVD